MKDASASSPGEQFERLVALMARLRAPDGCPWDREQTFDTIKPFLLEEAYEVLESIDQRDWPALADELGDLMLQAVFFAQMASEEGRFTISDSLEAICSKLVRRHPHVFADGDARTPAEVKQHWDRIKAGEKAERKTESMLDTIPRAVPALVEAQRISERVAAAGFDWENSAQVVEKLHEELAELEGAQIEADAAKLEDEIGDLLFTLVNLARFAKVDPEQALRRTNAKFRKRFGYVEQRLAALGSSPAQAGLERMEALWQEAKKTL